MSIEKGSIIAKLADIAAVGLPILKGTAEALKATTSIADFTRSLVGALKSAKRSKGPLFQSDEKFDFHRSTEAMIKIAADTGSEIELKYKGHKGDSFEVHFTSVEAIKIRERYKAKHAALPPPPEQLLLSDQSRELGDRQYRRIADALLRLPKPRDDGGGKHDLELIIELIADTLRRSGQSHLLETLAMELSGHGRSDLAALIRAENIAGGNTSAVTVGQTK